MEQSAEFIDFGSIDVTALIEAAVKIPDATWDGDMMVQKANPTHAETRVLLFFWPDDVSDASTGAPQPAWEEYKDLVQPVVDKIKGIYGEGSAPRAMLANLRPGAAIVPHTDTGGALRGSHRLHVPLQTNSDVDFIVNGDRKEMKIGRLYEFNNQLQHSVSNLGTESRIHLIIDYYRKDCGTGNV